MKNIITLIILLMASQIQAMVFEVAIDGTKPYTSIQTAINASNNGDIIRVYPGLYRENIDFNHHDVTLQSLYAITSDTNYVHNTKIIGNYTQPAITAQEGVTVEINGFTIMNNENQLEINVGWVGGGIFVFESNAIIKNNIITKCMMQSGGGLSISAQPLTHSYVYLENNKIFNCKAFQAGGGISISRNSEVIFSESIRNNVYNNYADYGKDIAFAMPTHDMHVYLDKSSKLMTTPDQFYIYEFYPLPYPDVEITVDINQAIMPLVAHDLYVAPWGDDDNNGLSEQSPLKTIDYATRFINPDAEHPLTIHLAEGTYSRILNQQIYPFGLKQWTSLKGAGMNRTILDDENIFSVMSAYAYDADIELSDFSIIRCGNNIFPSAALGVLGKNVTLFNLLFENNQTTFINGLSNNYSKHNMIRNVIVRNCTNDRDSKSLLTYMTENLKVENFITDNLHSTNSYGGGVGISMQHTVNLEMNNCSITNCSAFDPWVFQLSNWQREEENPPTGLCVINNMLIANNNTSPGDWDLAKIIINDEYNRVILNNWTVANNRGSSKILSAGGLGCTINNMLLYNPDVQYEISLGCPEAPNVPIWINNSLIYGGYDKIELFNNEDYLHINNMLTSAPLFAGEGTDSLSMGMANYYKLSANSPCIDAGLSDTTGTYINNKDFAGNQRIWGSRIDMGCFEYGAPQVGTEPELPEITDYNLKNYPNPVCQSESPYTIISFDYPIRSKNEPEIEIYNIKGQKVRTLKTGDSFYDIAKDIKLSKEAMQNIKTRNYSASWNCRDEHNKKVATGVYLYRAKIDGRIIQTKKMLILK